MNFLGVSTHHEWYGGGMPQKHVLVCSRCRVKTEIGDWDIPECKPQTVTDSSGYKMDYCFYPRIKIA